MAEFSLIKLPASVLRSQELLRPVASPISQASRHLLRPNDNELSELAHHRQNIVNAPDRECRVFICDSVWQQNPSFVEKRAATVGDVRNVATALFAARKQEGRGRSRQHLSGIGFVEQARPHAIAAHQANAVRKHEPSFVDLDW